MTAEEYLKRALSEFDDNEDSNDKCIAVFIRTVKAMEDFAEIKYAERINPNWKEELKKYFMDRYFFSSDFANKELKIIEQIIFGSKK